MNGTRRSAPHGSFGRRGLPTGASAARRSGDVRPSPAPPSARPKATVAPPPSLGDGVAFQASRGKAYVKAVLAGATTFLAVLFLLTGVENRFFQSGPMLAFLAVPILPTLALILYIPTVVLSDVARLLAVPRGWADMAIGLILGGGLGVAVVMGNAIDDGRYLMTALALTAGGFVGGFAFWRAQGYPGTSRSSARALDEVYDRVP